MVEFLTFFLGLASGVHSIELNVTDHYVELIEEGADLAIRIGGPTQSSYIVRKLAHIDRVLVAAKSYLESHGRPKRPQDLINHNCLIYQLHPGNVVWELIGEDGKHDIPVSGNFSSNNGLAIDSFMLKGGGIALLPVWIAGRAIQQGRIEVILPEYQAHPTGLGDDVYAVFPHARNLSPKVRACVDFIAKKFRTEPDFKMGVSLPHAAETA